MRITNFFLNLFFNLLAACFIIMVVYILATVLFGLAIIATYSILELIKELW